MWIHPKPVFNTTTTAAALVARATSDISSSSYSSSTSSSSSHHPECPPAYPSCDPEGGGPGPALLPVANADSSAGASADNLAGTGTGTLVTPTPQAALATSIQHFGKQNFVGLLVLGLFALAGLVLWLTFGAWPRRMMRRLRARGDCNVMGADGDRESTSEARRGADLDRDAASEGEGAHAHAREPSESEETKVQPASEEGAPGSPQSLEMEVEGLEKGTGEAASEAKGRTLPRVRFA